MTPTWKIVDTELARRRMSWAELGRRLGVTDQVMHNWKARKIPADRLPDIAGVLGWSIEQVMGVAPPEPPMMAEPVAEPTYSKRANDIAKMFDELVDPEVRQRAYAGVQAILSMAKAGQRTLAPAVEAKPSPPKQKSRQPAPAPKPKQAQRR